MITFSLMSFGVNIFLLEFNFDFFTIILDDVKDEDDIKNHNIEDLMDSYSILSISISDILYFELFGLELINYKIRE